MSYAPPREYYIRKGICPCDPTRGEDCRICDGTAAEEWECRNGFRPGIVLRPKTEEQTVKSPGPTTLGTGAECR